MDRISQRPGKIETEKRKINVNERTNKQGRPKFLKKLKTKPHNMPQQMPEWAGQTFMGGNQIMIFPEHFHCGIQTILFFWADKSAQLFYFAS